MKTEELTALGLNDEQVKGVFKLHGTAITALQNELGAANNTIKGLRDAAKKFEGVDVDKLRGDLEALQNKYDADVGAARLSGALDAALLTAKARDTRAVRPFIDMDRLSLDGDKLLGLEDQLKTLRAEKGFLFELDTDPGRQRGGMRHQSGAGGADTGTDEANAALRAAFGRG